MSAEAGTDYAPVPYPDVHVIAVQGDDVSRETSPDAPGVGPELLDANTIAESLTGFDEIALSQRFGKTLAKLYEDEPQLLRALYFIHLRRAEGATDKDAFRASMTIRLGDLQPMFTQGEPDALADPSAQAELDADFATFVASTGIPYTAEQYRTLTIGQRNAVYDALSKRR